MDADEANRVRLGASKTTSPEVLRSLATDPSVTVRASLALNPALPDQVVAILKADTDARVRAILSRKLAPLTERIPTETRQRVQKDAVASLTAMVAEAALRVRVNIAEAVRDMPEGPRDIVLRLAQDPAVMVCEPVILFSPMLTQEDLATLIASGPPSTILAVANRPRIGPAVSDAIVEVADPAAIKALLCNHTAQIREATLDALAAQSEHYTDWQEPLVRRPQLSPRAQRMLAEIVTGHLLEALAARADLDPKVGETLRAAMDAKTPTGASSGRSGGATKAELNPRAALARAEALKQSGRLDDYAIVDALRTNEMMSAKAMLALKAGVALPVVERACDLRSAKAIVSLAWKAGQTAVVLQTMLANLGAAQTLRPGRVSGFPLSEDEMRWQLTFLGASETETQTWLPRQL
jgi:uncharacterized protein (DUF2336 family)